MIVRARRILEAHNSAPQGWLVHQLKEYVHQSQRDGKAIYKMANNFATGAAFGKVCIQSDFANRCDERCIKSIMTYMYAKPRLYVNSNVHKRVCYLLRSIQEIKITIALSSMAAQFF